MNPFEEQFNQTTDNATMNQSSTSQANSDINLSANKTSNTQDFFTRIINSMKPVQQLMIDMNNLDNYIDRQVNTVFVDSQNNKLYRVIVARTNHKFQNYFLYVICHTDNVDSGLALVVRGLGYIFNLLESGCCENIQVADVNADNVTFVDRTNGNVLLSIPNCTWQGLREFVKFAINKLLTTKGKTKASSTTNTATKQNRSGYQRKYQSNRGNWQYKNRNRQWNNR